MSCIEAQNIKFKYSDSWILKSVAFQTHEGEFLGVIGPNGSGKTTLIKIIDGLLIPDEGAIFLRGQNIKHFSRNEIAKIVAMVPQDAPVVFPFTVQEVVMMGRTPHLGRLRFEGKTDFEIVRKAMEITDILPFASRSINELSGGERQRVLIARALAQQPQIILLDESTAFLDIKHQLDFFDLIKVLNREEGLTVITVTHDINLASLFCDRVLLLRDGNIHSIGTPHEVITESNIKEVYEANVMVDRNPITGLPRVTLLASHPAD
jgi:iron complex transport system ATP-binding protein